jgi:hypothetical protein
MKRKARRHTDREVHRSTVRQQQPRSVRSAIYRASAHIDVEQDEVTYSSRGLGKGSLVFESCKYVEETLYYVSISALSRMKEAVGKR